MGLNRKQIDAKYHIESFCTYCGSGLGTDVEIVKTGNNQPIPEDEPTIIFRGRDKLALPMLMRYRELCRRDGCTDYQMKAIDVMIEKFAKFADDSPTMKQPGITEGK